MPLFRYDDARVLSVLLYECYVEFEGSRGVDSEVGGVGRSREIHFTRVDGPIKSSEKCRGKRRNCIEAVKFRELSRLCHLALAFFPFFPHSLNLPSPPSPPSYSHRRAILTVSLPLSPFPLFPARLYPRFRNSHFVVSPSTAPASLYNYSPAMSPRPITPLRHGEEPTNDS